MNERIENYIHSIMPKNISKKRKQLIYDEMESHILEQAEFYMEIGYDEKVSIDKALECMGEDDETKRSIINRFEELYLERTFFAIIAAVVIFLLNLMMFYSDAWLISVDANDDTGIAAYKILLSGAMTCLMIIFPLILYKWGFRKSLIGAGIANIIIAATVYWAFYPQCLSYTVILSVEYILERFTSLLIPPETADLIQYDGTLFGSIAWIVCTAALCFILAVKIRRRGIPKLPAKSVIATAVCFLILSVAAVHIYPNAEKYFDNYPTGLFNDENGDTFSEVSLHVYGLLNSDMTNEEAAAVLHENGYVSVKEYLADADKLTAKHFRYNLDNATFYFDDSFDIYFREFQVERYLHRYEQPLSDYDPLTEYAQGYQLIFLKEGADGKIAVKGVGNGFENFKIYDCNAYFCCDMVDLIQCERDFHELKTGDPETEVMEKFGGEYGEIYTEFTVYSGDTTRRYYRVHCSGDNTYYRDKKDIYCLYFTFAFEDGKLTDRTIFKRGCEGDIGMRIYH